jgi:hypothetical protein
MYHNSGTNAPFQYAIRVKNSSDIVWRGIHNFSGGPFPFDNTLMDVDSGALVAHPEIGELRVR